MGQPMEPLSAQPVGCLLARATEVRAMATAARSLEAATALVRLAERLEALAAKRLAPRDADELGTRGVCSVSPLSSPKACQSWQSNGNLFRA